MPHHHCPGWQDRAGADGGVLRAAGAHHAPLQTHRAAAGRGRGHDQGPAQEIPAQI